MAMFVSNRPINVNITLVDPKNMKKATLFVECAEKT